MLSDTSQILCSHLLNILVVFFSSVLTASYSLSIAKPKLNNVKSCSCLRETVRTTVIYLNGQYAVMSVILSFFWKSCNIPELTDHRQNAFMLFAIWLAFQETLFMCFPWNIKNSMAQSSQLFRFLTWVLIFNMNSKENQVCNINSKENHCLYWSFALWPECKMYISSPAFLQRSRLSRIYVN